MRLACYQPEIAGNMGALMRLAACFDVGIDIVEPCGFVFSDAKMRRAGMDYAAQVAVVRHADWSDLHTAAPGRIVLLTTKASDDLYDFTFDAADTLLLGSESVGVPDTVATHCDARLRIPIAPSVRSLNIAVAAGIALGEALRQTRRQTGDANR